MGFVRWVGVLSGVAISVAAGCSSPPPPSPPRPAPVSSASLPAAAPPAGSRLVRKPFAQDVYRLEVPPDAEPPAWCDSDEPAVEWHPSGEALALLDGKDIVIVDSEQLRLIRRYPNEPGRFAFTRDGRVLVTSRAVHHLDTGVTRELPRPGRPSDLAITRDGAAFAIADRHHGVVLYDMATLTPRHLDRDTSPLSLAFTPDGQTLAVSYEMISAASVVDGINWFDVSSGKLAGRLPLRRDAFGMQFGPRGQWLYFATFQDGTVFRSNLRTRQREHVFGPTTRGVMFDVLLSDDGHTVVADVAGRPVIVAPDGSGRGEPDGPWCSLGRGGSIALSPDAKRIAIACRPARIWDLETDTWRTIRNVAGDKRCRVREGPSGIVASGSERVTPKPMATDCRTTVLCRARGQCTTIGTATCMATSDAMCRESADCRDHGFCVADHGICVREDQRP